LIEIRWHGRGGQGAVTAAELLAHAAINDGKFAQAIPSFGPERRGAPVAAFNRISNQSIGLRSNVYEPDIVVVIEPSLLGSVNVKEGLKDNGSIIINSGQALGELKAQYNITHRTAVVDAKRIALDEIGLPITNTAMLGALVKVSNLVNLDSILEAVKERFSGKAGERNISAVKRAYNETLES
jgi:pyruvate ferredoxin oxidoreductase gamma subunit